MIYHSPYETKENKEISKPRHIPIHLLRNFSKSEVIFSSIAEPETTEILRKTFGK